MREIDVLYVMKSAPINRYLIMIVVLCGILIIFDGYDTAIMGLCMTDIKADLQIDSVVGGYLGSASLIGMFFGAILTGILSDRIGRKKMIIVNLIIFAAFTGLNSFARTPGYFFTMRLLAGFGLGGIYPVAFSTASEFAPAGRKGIMVVMVGIGMEIGKILAVVVGLTVRPAFGWRAVFLICALPLLLVPVIIKYLPDTIPLLMRHGDENEVRKILGKMNPSYVPQDDDILIYELEDHEKVRAGSFKALFTHGRALNTVCFIVLYSTVVFIGYACLTWLPDLMVTHGYSMAIGQFSQMALQLGTLIASLLFGIIADKKGFKPMLVAMYATGFVALVGMGATVNFGPYVTMAFLVVVGACCCDQNLNHAYISASYPAAIRGTMLGWGLGIARIPGIGAPILLGYLSAAGLPLSVIFTALAVVPLLSLICVVLSKDIVTRKNKRLEQSEI